MARGIGDFYCEYYDDYEGLNFNIVGGLLMGISFVCFTMSNYVQNIVVNKILIIYKMKQTKKVLINKKKVLTRRRREKHKKTRKNKRHVGGGFLLPIWQSMLLEINDLYGVNQELTSTIRKNLNGMPPEEKDPWAGGGGKLRRKKYKGKSKGKSKRKVK